MSRTQDWQTQRRLQALALHEKGWQQKTIAEALGVSKGAVSQWLKRARGLPPLEQAAALQVRKSSGRPPLLSGKQKRQVASLVERDAEAFGFVGSFWTLKRVQQAARREFGITVSIGTIRRSLLACGLSCQKPQTVARERNAREVAGFKGGWVNLKKGPSEAVPR